MDGVAELGRRTFCALQFRSVAAWRTIRLRGCGSSQIGMPDHHPMKHSRITLAVSTLALGVTLGLQPLSVSFTAQMFDTVGAIAKGGDGNGGGGQGGGGHGGGGGTGGGGHGSAGDARGGGHGPDKSKSDSSVAERGSRD